jgi:hypothetical protein
MNENLRTVLHRHPNKLACGARNNYFVSPTEQQASAGQRNNLSVTRKRAQAPIAGGIGQRPRKRAHQHSQTHCPQGD